MGHPKIGTDTNRQPQEPGVSIAKTDGLVVSGKGGVGRNKLSCTKEVGILPLEEQGHRKGIWICNAGKCDTELDGGGGLLLQIQHQVHQILLGTLDNLGNNGREELEVEQVPQS